MNDAAFAFLRSFHPLCQCSYAEQRGRQLRPAVTMPPTSSRPVTLGACEWPVTMPTLRRDQDNTGVSTISLSASLYRGELMCHGPFQLEPEPEQPKLDLQSRWEVENLRNLGRPAIVTFSGKIPFLYRELRQTTLHIVVALGRTKRNSANVPSAYWRLSSASIGDDPRPPNHPGAAPKSSPARWTKNCHPVCITC